MTFDLTSLPSIDSRCNKGQDHSSYLPVDEAMQFDVVRWYQVGLGILAQYKSLMKWTLALDE